MRVFFFVASGYQLNQWPFMAVIWVLHFGMAAVYQSVLLRLIEFAMSISGRGVGGLGWWEAWSWRDHKKVDVFGTMWWMALGAVDEEYG